MLTDPRFTLIEVLAIVFISMIASGVFSVGLERHHKSETDALRRRIDELTIKIEIQSETINRMSARLWPAGGGPNSRGGNVTVNTAGGQGVFDSTAGRDINQADGGHTK